MKFIHLCIPWTRLGVRARVVIVVLVFMIAARWAPDATVPLGIGGSLGLWLTVPLTSRIRARRRLTWAR
jgi:hypothetical protein